MAIVPISEQLLQVGIPRFGRWRSLCGFCADSVQICCTAITFGGIKIPISAVIKFAYFTAAVNYRLQGVEHRDGVARPTVHTGTTPRANLAFKATVLIPQGISLLLVHHSASLTT
jgi:hypothetical protein